MTYNVEDIVMENEKAFAIKIGEGIYEIYEIGLTHSTRKGTICHPKGSIETIKRAFQWSFIDRYGKPFYNKLY